MKKKKGVFLMNDDSNLPKKLVLSQAEQAILATAGTKSFSGVGINLATELRGWMEKQERIPKGTKPNPGQVRRALTSEVNIDLEAQTLCLIAFRAQASELFKVCADYLKERGFDGIHPFIDNSVLEESVASIAREYPNLGGEDEIRLVFRLLDQEAQKSEVQVDSLEKSSQNEKLSQGGKPVDQNNSDTNPELIPIGWNDIYTQLLTTPANAACWDTVEEFIVAVRTLANTRLSEQLEEQTVRQLEDLLALHQAELSEQASILELEDPLFKTWQIESFSKQSLVDVIDELQRLVINLKQLKDVRSQPIPERRSERQKLNDLLSALEEDCIAGYQHLLALKSSEDKLPDEDLEKDTQVVEAVMQDDPFNLEVETQKDEPVEEIIRGAEIPEDLSSEEDPEIAQSLESQDVLVNEDGESQVGEVAEGHSDDGFIESPQPEAVWSGEYDGEDIPEGEIDSDEDDSDDDIKSELERTEITHLVVLPNDLDPQKSNMALLQRLFNADFSAAYWLAFGMEQLGIEPTAASWSVAALQGALWHLSAWPEPPSGWFESLYALCQPRTHLVEEPEAGVLPWLRYSAGLLLSLLDPSGGWQDWIEEYPPHRSQASIELSDIVHDAIRKGVWLDPEWIRPIVNAEKEDEYIHNLAEDAKLALAQASQKRGQFLRASEVWQRLIKYKNSELYQVLLPAAEDRRDAASTLRDQIDHWTDRAWLSDHIVKLDREMQGKKSRPIMGSARDQLILWITDICQKASAWADAVQRWESLQHEANWKYTKVKEFCEDLSVRLPALRQELKQRKQEQPTYEELAGLVVFDQALLSLQNVLNPDEQAHLISPSPLPVLSLDGTPSIETCLTYRLYFYPELNLDEQGYLKTDEYGRLVQLLTYTTERSIEQVLEGWIAQRDYRYTGILLRLLEDRASWEIRLREALLNDIHNLKTHEIEENVVTIEQCWLDGLLSESEYVEYISHIESVRKALANLEVENASKVSLRALSARMANQKRELEARRQSRLEKLELHWKSLYANLDELSGGEEKFAKQINAAIENAIQQRDLRLLGEYLAHLDSARASGRPLNKSLVDDHPAPELRSFEEFQEFLPRIVNLLEPPNQMSLVRFSNSILKDQPLEGISKQSLPVPRRKEVVQALEAWHFLKKNGLESPKQTLVWVASLMSFLGFPLENYSPVSLQPEIPSQTNMRHWKILSDIGLSSPVPQFGSLRKGSYDLFGVWDRPGAEELTSKIQAVMQRTTRLPAILLYFHYLTPARREKLLSTIYREKSPILVVDEVLLLYLALQTDSRLKPMFYCTLPYSILNPYVPTGLVPPEIYKGRGDKVTALMDPNGPVIVYGGRQLGKTALLRQVQREMILGGQFALFLDIRPVGNPASGINYQEDLRDRLAKELVQADLLEKNRVRLDFDHLLQHVRQLLNKTGKRMILLLDEADFFLDADASQSFYILVKLKELMEQTGKQFKIILAGLHDVQRFKDTPNQPLAHLQTPIEIGPLDPDAARELLMQPLHALGFRFRGSSDRRKEDLSLIFHILSYTNYHPGLIQLFGKKLVEHIHENNQRSKRPSRLITRSLVERVYLDHEVREGIYDKFKLTLDLDRRYEAITLALILSQWDDQNGFDHLYPVRELRELAAGWWPEAFPEDISTERFEGFLREMRGLGVLSTSQDGRSYRLRSPNLVSLMGTYEEIWERMEAITKDPPPGDRALENCHARLKDLDQFSPLSFIQEKILSQGRSGVALIFGSHASGISNLDSALKRLLPEGSGVWKEIRVKSNTGLALQEQLASFYRENADAATLLAYREMSGMPAEMLEQIEAAEHICRGLRARTLRVCFSFDPQTAWNWFNLPAENRHSLEERIVTVVSLKRWDRVSVRQRLEMETWESGALNVSDKLVERVLETTGGWDYLLDEFIQHCGRGDPEMAISEFKRILFTQPSQLAADFLNNLGIVETLPRNAIQTLQIPDVRELIDQGFEISEALAASMNLPSVEADDLVEYLKRMAVLTEPGLSLESVIARIWHGN
jgi:hypothetical protein